MTRNPNSADGATGRVLEGVEWFDARLGKV